MFSAGKAGFALILNCPKFPNFGKAENFFKSEKKFEKLENSGRPNFVEKGLTNLTYQKKAPFSYCRYGAGRHKLSVLTKMLFFSKIWKQFSIKITAQKFDFFLNLCYNIKKTLF